METEHQKAGRGLTSCSPHHINWKGMKCQACFHHSETVKTLPPPSSSSHQPVTPQTFSPTSPTRLPLPTTSHSHDQIIFQPPEICLARQKSAAQSRFCVRARSTSLVSLCLSATTKEIDLLFNFYFLPTWPLLRWLCVCS